MKDGIKYLVVLTGLSFPGCYKLHCEFEGQAQYCQNFEMMSLGSLDRAQQSATLKLQIPLDAEGRSSVAPSEENFRVFIENAGTQMGGKVPGTPTIKDLWSLDVELRDPLPSPQALRCGDATLYLHAGRTDTKVEIPGLTPAGDADSQYYLQHGKVKFQVVDFRPPQALSPMQAAFNQPSVQAYFGLSVRSVGTNYAIFGNAIPSGPMNYSLAQTCAGSCSDPPKLGSGLLLVGDFQSATSGPRSLLLQTGLSGNLADSIIWSCPRLMDANVSLNDKCQVAPSKLGMPLAFTSLAMDQNGSFFATVNPSGQLSIYNWDDAGLKATLLNLDEASAKVTQVVTGDLNGDDASDILALRGSDDPLVLLRDKAGQTFHESPDIEKALSKAVPTPMSFKTMSARVAIGRFECAARASAVMVTDFGKLSTLVPDGQGQYRAGTVTLPEKLGGQTLLAIQLADLAGASAGSEPDGLADTLVALQANGAVFTMSLQSPQ